MGLGTTRATRTRWIFGGILFMIGSRFTCTAWMTWMPYASSDRDIVVLISWVLPVSCATEVSDRPVKVFQGDFGGNLNEDICFPFAGVDQISNGK